MAHDTTILNGDVGVWWLSNNRSKLLHWIGGTNDTYTMNELYSAMQTLQDESTTIDDGTCFYADTPLEYTTGIIDQGDSEPWYVSYELMEHITGGALRTASWERDGGGTGNCGIVMVEVASANSNFVPADRGEDITNGTTSDAGTLLEVLVDGGASDYLIIRPDSNATANDFDGTTGTLTGGTSGHTATSITAGATTGEQIWANVYSIGTIEENTKIYLYQGPADTTDARDQVFSVQDNTEDYWGNGHIDMVVPLKDMTQSTWSVIDEGYVYAYARQGRNLYSFFEVSNSTVSGGRNPAAINTEVDANATAVPMHGTAKISTGSWTGTFVDGEIIQQATTLARGIIDLTNSTTDSEIVYWPITDDAVGGTITAMADTYAITSQGAGSGSATASSASSADGPADSAWFTGTEPTVAFGFATADIDNDTNDEYYGITIDCNQSPLTEVYQWLQYISGYDQENGDALETAEDNIDGQEYTGGMAYFTYSAISGTIAEGEAVTQATTGAKGVILSHDTTNDIVLLRSVRGTFNGSNQIDADDDADYFTPSAAGNFAPKGATPFGSLAGGIFFGARGVLLTDYLSADENSFTLVDIGGTSRERPTSIYLELTNCVGTDETTSTDDLVAIYRLTGSGGTIDKSEMTCDGGEAAGDTTLAVDAIGTDVPTAGTLVLVDVSDDNTEYAIRYSSYDAGTDTFTLANIDIPAADGGSTTTVQETGAFTNAKRGDLVYNHDLAEVTYVETVDSDNQITVSPAFSGDPTGDHVELNCIPITTTASDEAFVPFMLRYATSGTEQVSIIYDTTVYFRARVRNTRATTKIRPYSSDGSTSGTNQSIPVVRNTDTIIT